MFDDRPPPFFSVGTWICCVIFGGALTSYFVLDGGTTIKLVRTLLALNSSTASDEGAQPSEFRRFFWEGNVHSWHTTFSPDSRYLLVSGDSGSVAFFEAKSGKHIREFRHDFATAGWTNCSKMSPDSKLLVTGGNNSLLGVWNVETGDRIRTFAGHKGHINSIDISLDGKRVLSGSGDKSIRLWDIETGREVRSFDGNGVGCGAVFTPDNKRILCWSGDRGGDSLLVLYDVETGRELRTFEGHKNGVARGFVLQDGKQVVSYGWDSTVRIWDLVTAAQEHMFDFGNLEYELQHVAPSLDGKYIVVAENRKPNQIGQFPPVIRLIATDDWEEVRRFECQSNPKGLSFSPDGSLAACGSWRGYIYVWQMPRRPQLQPQ